MYTVLIMWSRPVCVTPTGQILPEVPTTSKEVTFDSKSEPKATLLNPQARLGFLRE